MNKRPAFSFRNKKPRNVWDGLEAINISPPWIGKAFLYRAHGTRVHAMADDALREEILAQEEQEPFRSVEELQPWWTKPQPAV